MNIIIVNSKEYEFEKNYHSPVLLRECNKNFHFVDWFLEALENSMNDFISCCRKKSSVSRSFVVSFNFDEKRDTVVCIFDFNPFMSRCYSFMCHGNSWSFRSRKKLLHWVENTLVNFGCEYSK